VLCKLPKCIHNSIYAELKHESILLYQSDNNLGTNTCLFAIDYKVLTMHPEGIQRILLTSQNTIRLVTVVTENILPGS